VALTRGGAFAVQDSRKDDGLNGSPGQGRVQLRPVPPQQHAGEERAQAPRIQEDRDNHRRPRLSGAAFSCRLFMILRFGNRFLGCRADPFEPRKKSV